MTTANRRTGIQPTYILQLFTFDVQGHYLQLVTCSLRQLAKTFKFTTSKFGRLQTNREIYS